MRHQLWAAAMVLSMAASAWAQATGGNPADQQKKGQEQEKKQAGHQTDVVEGKKISDLQEEDLIGPSQQPRWTAARRFTTTRIYVVPQGEIEFEWWARITDPRDEDDPTQARYLWEIEIGLPYRFQLDLYLGMEGEGDEGMFDFSRQQIEIRWAPAIGT